jgi:MoxR-like ATPase
VLADVPNGLSPRSGIGLLNATRAWALIAGRDHVRPEDVQAVLPAVAGHRLQPGARTARSEEMIRQLIESVPVP